MSDNLLIKRECESLLGGGGTYHSDLIEANKSARVSCDGIIREEGFVLVFGCNTCTSKNIQERLKQDTIACTKQCRMTMNSCVYDGISNDWGGYYNTDQHPSCSPLKSTSLPGCAESSSSVGEDEQSSSSETPVSSEAESSSSEEEELESSSSGEIDSSSSDDDSDEDYSSSSERGCGNGTGKCPIKEDSLGRNTPYDEIDCTYSRTPFREPDGVGECVTKWVPQANSFRKNVTQNSSVPPTMDPRDLDKITFQFTCTPSKGMDVLPNEHYNHLKIRSNVPYARIQERYVENFYCYKTLDDCLSKKNEILMVYPEGFWCAPRTSNAYTTMTDYGCSIMHPYEGKSDKSGMTFHYTREDGFSVFFDEDGVLLSNLSEGFLFDAIRNAAKSAEMTIVFKENGTSVYPNIEAMDDACAERQNRGGNNRSSSSKMESSSSEEKSSSSEKEEMTSSSSTQINSSSSKTIEVSSSSMETKSSSSVYVETSSSSRQGVSSSLDFVYSSSNDDIFVAGDDREYTPDQIFKDGLDNMEKGKCYSLNPARGTQHGWINTNAQDSWWWREVDCETGDKVDNNRVGACPGFPLDNVPSKPKNACFAYNGSCYKCNPDRGPECSNSWLWQGSFASGNIGWWYEKVDCYDPFEDDFDGQCPDGVLLKKNAASEGNAMSNYKIDYSLSSNFFDAKGRRLNGDRSKFLKAFKKQKKKIKPVKVTTFDVGHIIYIPIEDLGLSRNYLAKDGDACRAKSCGNLGKDYGVNGDVGVYCGYPCTELIEENGYLRIEITKKKQTGSCSEGNPKYTITFKLSAKTTIKRKNVYYVAPIGYKMGSSFVTEDAYKAGKRHEIGHMKSFECLEKNKMFESEYVFALEGVCEDEFKCNKKGVIKGLADNIKKSIIVQRETGKDELLKYNKNLWLKMCGWYHEKFSRYDGPGGPKNPKDIVCPTTATLLNTNYVLTGCEVFE